MPPLTSAQDPSRVLWDPPRDGTTHIERWMKWLASGAGPSAQTYDDLWAWSVDAPSEFWDAIWNYFEVIGTRGEQPALTGGKMPEHAWFPDSRLNYAENLLARLGPGPVVVGRSESRDRVALDAQELRAEVAAVAAGLRARGIAQGDRVAAYLPNIPEALILMLACASLGAIFTSCAPEFGVRAVTDRLTQVQPRLLVAVNGYRHKGRPIDRRDHVREIREAVTSVEEVIGLEYLPDVGPLSDSTRWEDLPQPAPEFEPVQVSFDHPLVILYSSGTTGLPKPIVHGHGGVLLEHLKLHHLHHDLHDTDVFFWYSTTGWVMWNYLMSGLLTGARIVMFDGDPAHPQLDALWQLAAEEHVTVFGGSAPYFLACRNAPESPTTGIDLRTIRQVCSTGAPLSEEGYRWIHEHVSDTAMIVSASGGTDVCSAFVAGVPILPVVAGEITCRCLGVRAEAFDESGRSVVGEVGELVITAPMPSMPVGLWGDEDGSRYRSAYFDRFPGVWAHGDLIRIAPHGACEILGRSDATLNRGGVRLGTADFYPIVESVPGIDDSLVVHLEDPEGGPGTLILFVVVGGGDLTDDMTDAIRHRLRTEVSPRHVPNHIVQVAGIPRTLTGKKLEVPVKRILQGKSAEDVVSLDAIQDPRLLVDFQDLDVAALS